MLRYGNVNEGDKIPPITVVISREKLNAYCKVTKEIVPIHFDEKVARALGFKTVVVQGVFSFSFIPKMLTEWIGNPTCIKEIEVSFIAPLYPEENVTFTGKILRKYEKDGERLLECEIWAEKENGEKIIDGTAVISIQ